jgi:hypothetical protein
MMQQELVMLVLEFMSFHMIIGAALIQFPYAAVIMLMVRVIHAQGY